MKIVHVSEYFHPKLGYQETFLAKAQQKLGHEVYVVTSDRYYPFPYFETTYSSVLGNRRVGSGFRLEEEIRTIRLQSYEVPNFPLIYLRNFKQTLIQLKPDIVFGHGVYSITAYQLALLKRNLRFTLIYDTHVAAFNTNFNSSIYKRYMHTIYTLFVMPQIKKAADKIFAIGKEEQKFLSEDYSINVTSIPIVPLGVDVDLFKPNQKQRKLMRKKLGWKNDDIVVIFCGKIAPNKDVHVLIDALSAINDDRLKLLLLGGGDKSYIEKLVRLLDTNGKRYCLQQFVKNIDLPCYYQAADIGVWPGDPTIAILEALASGVPLILPKSHELRYLRNSKAVQWFQRGNVRDLQLKIQYWVENNSERKQAGKSSTRYAKVNLSWKILAQKSLHLTKNVD